MAASEGGSGVQTYLGLDLLWTRKQFPRSFERVINIQLKDKV